MNANTQKALDYIKDELNRGIIDAKEANIRFIEAKRFTIIRRSIPADVRKAFNEGVKQGRLIRVKKSDNAPEYYYKPNFEHLAKQEIYGDKTAMVNAMKKICG